MFEFNRVCKEIKQELQCEREDKGKEPDATRTSKVAECVMSNAIWIEKNMAKDADKN